MSEPENPQADQPALGLEFESDAKAIADKAKTLPGEVLQKYKSSNEPQNQSVRFALLRSLIGGRVVVQEKGGPIVTGLFVSFADGEGYLKLTDATVTGRTKQAKPPFVLVHFTAIAHIHPEAATEKV